MTSYVRERTAGGIISDSFSLYFRNFWLFLVLYLGPVIILAVPAAVLVKFLPLTGAVKLSDFAGTSVAQAMLTVAVSDICLGNPPGLGRCFRKAWQRIGPLVVSSLLVTIAILVGEVMLIVPGLIALTMLLFTTTIVIIERRRPVQQCAAAPSWDADSIGGTSASSY